MFVYLYMQSVSPGNNVGVVVVVLVVAVVVMPNLFNAV